MNVYPQSQTKKTVKEIERIGFNFIRKSKKSKISKKVMFGDFSEGGKNMLCLHSMISAQRLMWAQKRLYKRNIIFEFCLKQCGGVQLVLHSNIDKTFVTKLYLSLFYKEIFQIWCKQEKTVNKELLWNNKRVQVNGNTIFRKDLLKASLWFISDLYTEEKKVIPFTKWVQRGIPSCDNHSSIMFYTDIIKL